jgi:hypothetical protein
VADNVFSVARPISTIEQEIRSLSASDQEGLLRVLLEELDGPPDLDAEAAWLDEVRKRTRELDAGAVECIPRTAGGDRDTGGSAANAPTPSIPAIPPDTGCT